MVFKPRKTRVPHKKKIFKKKQYKRRIPRALTNIVKIRDTCQLTTTNANNYMVGNKPYVYAPILSPFLRAAAIAKNYQFYRITRMKFTFTPIAPLGEAPVQNMGTTVSGTEGRKSDFYYYLARNGTPGSTGNLNWFLDMGCKPRAFGSSSGRNITVVYKPNTTMQLTNGPVDPNTGAIVPMFNKWINCYVSGAATNFNAQYNEMYWYWDDTAYSTASQYAIAECRMEADFEFKTPYVVPPPTTDAGDYRGIPFDTTLGSYNRYVDASGNIITPEDDRM